MSRCKMQVVQEFALKELESSVSSYICSVRYMKKIVPLTVYNIIYNRVDLDENLFVDKLVCDISFKTFKSGTSNQLFDVFYWCKGAADAIAKKYLREMHLLFQDKSDDSIIENYKYSFAYHEEPNCPAKMPNSEDVIAATRQFFQSIQSLSEHKKMNKDVNILIELILFDDVIPGNYDMPYFTCTEDIPFCIRALTNAESTTIGQIQTGYHKLKCSVQGLPFDTMNNSVLTEEVNFGEIINANENSMTLKDDDVIEKDIDDHTSVVSNMNYEYETMDPDIIIDRDGIQCPCEINALIGSSGIVKCTICLKYQHLICNGCINMDTLSTPYICVYCNGDDRKAFDNYLLTHELQTWKLVCGSRLVINYCYNYGVTPQHLLQRLDDNTRKHVLNLIKGIKSMEGDSCGIVRFNKQIVMFMSRLFCDFFQPPSLLLEDTQDVEIIE